MQSRTVFEFKTPQSTKSRLESPQPFSTRKQGDENGSVEGLIASVSSSRFIVRSRKGRSLTGTLYGLLFTGQSSVRRISLESSRFPDVEIVLREHIPEMDQRLLDH